MKRHFLRVNETIATVIAEERFFKKAIIEVQERRRDLEKYILSDPFFLSTFEPYDTPSDAPAIVRRMAEAARIAGVGPMAAVAGAIAHYALEAMVEAGAECAIFDNGGDIAMHIDKPTNVGIYTGWNEPNQLGLKFLPREEIFGVCTSSASVGHSISFGKSDATTVISNDVILADAIATALGNLIISNDDNIICSSMRKKMVDGIEGMMVIIGNKIGLCGNLPQIIKANVDYKLITKG